MRCRPAVFLALLVGGTLMLTVLVTAEARRAGKTPKVGVVFKGTAPADLPVEQPARFEREGAGAPASAVTGVERRSGHRVTSPINRRAFLAIATAALAPRAAEAKEGKRYRVGLLSSGRPAPPGPGESRDRLLTIFAERMKSMGYTEGENLQIEPRWAQGDLDRLPVLAAQLVASRVDVILAAGNPAVEAARSATSSVPIVMLAANPVAAGFVESLSRPGVTLTGLSVDAGAGIWGKRMALLKEAAPKIARVAVLSRSGGRKGAWVREVESVAARLGVVLVHAGVERRQEFSAAFAVVSAGRPDALLVSDTPLNFQDRRLIIEFARREGLPDIHGYREAAADGGLLAYGVDIADLYRRAASYVSRLLNGASPRDLPIEQPTKFELVINLKTAKALGLTMPPSLLLRADQVIEE
jgi:putative ABC transport system substrate-binding protein